MPATPGSAFRPLGRFLRSAALGLAVALWVPAAYAAAQQEGGVGGRWKVLVVPLDTEGLNRRFGQDVADRVIKGLKQFATHTAISKSELRKACRTYRVKCEDLNAITSRQMAAQLKAQVVMFGTVKPDGDAYRVNAAFTDVKTGDEIRVPSMAVRGRGDADRVAQEILSAFESAVTFQRARAFCQQYVGSRQPENALSNCDRALAINPRSSVALYYKGTAFRLLGETDTAHAAAHFDSAIAYYDKVREVQPGHKDALQSLAWVHSRKGNADLALKLYREFLALDPENTAVRLAVAHDLAQDGLYHEALDLLNEGLKGNGEKIDLWQYKGTLSLRLAQDEAPYADSAIVAYRKVYEARGAEADTTIVTNLLAAYAQAGRLGEALAFGEKALQTHPNSAGLWSQYAVALPKAKRHRDAAAAMDRVLQIEPDYPNGYVRRGRYRYNAGDETGAHGDFRRAVERGQATADELADYLFAEGYQAFSKGKDLARAQGLYKAALQYCKDPRRCSQIHFFWGYALYVTGSELDKREDLRSIRRALDLFQQATPHIRKGRAARAKDAQKILEDLEVFIAREQARIKQAQRSG